MVPFASTVRLKFRYPVAIIGIIVGTFVWWIGTTLLYSSDTITKDTFRFLTRFQLNDPNPLRAFASMFSHANFWHWFGNMLFLWIFGTALEDRLGPRKFLALFLISGVGALAIFWLFYFVNNLGGPYPDDTYLGASGAISGIMGLSARRFPKAKVVLGLDFNITSRILSLKVPMLWFVLYSLGKDVYRTFDGDGVAHMAHIGGFLAGFVIASRLKFEKEGEAEILTDQAQELYDRGWYPQALERYDRLVVLDIRDGKFQEMRARCLYKLWPANGRPRDTQRAQLLDALERCLKLYRESKQDEAAWRLYHDLYVVS